MKTANSWQAGYTIVEVMIFLIISSFLLVSALGMFSGKIGRTQFSQSVQALDTRIRSIANESATGTYPDQPAFDCSVSLGSRPNITTLGSTATQGSRTDCTFAGKIINFTVPSSTCTSPTSTSKCTKVEVYTVVGRRVIDSAGTVPNGLIGATGADPTVVTSLTQSFDLGGSMRVTGLYQKTVAFGNVATSGLGLFQSFNGAYSNGNLTSGAQNAEVWFVKKTPTPVAPIDAATMATAVTNEQLSKLQVTSNVLLCLRSGSSNQNGSITLSSAANGALTTNVTIGDPQCP